MILKELGLEGCKPVTTPCGPQEQRNSLQDQDSELLRGTEATKFRAVVARLNYLAMDRPGIQYATKEAAKRMANPLESDWLVLKRVGRYLAGASRLVQLMEWQAGPLRFTTYVDSDLAGDRRPVSPLRAAWSSGGVTSSRVGARTSKW